MNSSSDIGPAFRDPVLQSQAVFRAIMSAMAEPGTIATLKQLAGPPQRLGCAMASVALTLCDFETSVWLDDEFRLDPEVAAYIRFHTGARIAERQAEATFALVTRPEALPPLSSFSLGTPEFPDRSTTVVVEVEVLETGRGWRVSGPGIAGVSRLAAEPFAADFTAQLKANRDLFPRGVDLVLCCGERLAALPRSVRIVGED